MGFGSGFGVNFTASTRFSGGGGGGGNDPAFPTGDLSIDEDSGTVSFNMVNNGDTPAAVEFSFSGTNYLEAADPDHGTPTSPSFVVDPDDTPREIQFKRGSVDVPAENTVVTATYSSTGGPIGSFNITLDPVSFYGAVRSFATPTVEFSKGVLTNAGSLGSTYDWINNGLAGNLSTSPRAARSKFGGWHLYDATGRSLSLTTTNTNAPFKRAAGQSRTWLIAYESDNASGYSQSNSYISPYGTGTSTTPGALLYATTAGTRAYYYKDTGASRLLDTNNSHTDGGSSELLKVYGTYQSLCVVAIVWDSVAQNISVYWKQENHTRSGFSYFTEAVPSFGLQNAVSTYDIDIVGKGNSSSDGRPIKTFYYGVLDQTITQANFQSLLNAAGIG
jgi:hypothetical protein